MNLLSLLIPAILPALADGLKGLFQRLFGGTKPVTVDDQIKLMQAEVEKLKALAELDKPSSEVSRWVADLRGAFRYLAAGAIILTTVITLFVPGVNPDFINLMLQLTASVFSFMFGDRVYLHLKRG